MDDGIARSYVFNAQDVVNWINLLNSKGARPKVIYISKELYVTPDAKELLNNRKIKIRWVDSDGEVEEQDVK